MATSTEKLDHVGRAVAQVRDNFRNFKKAGVISEREFNVARRVLDDVKTRVRKFEEEEYAYWTSLLASEPSEEDAA